MNKFINTNIGLLFALVILICAAGVSEMTDEYQFSPKEQQAFDEIFNKQEQKTQEQDDEQHSTD